MFNMNIFKNKDILVTGGCGSIGSEIVKRLINHNPKRIRIFDNNESALFEFQQNVNEDCLRFLVGDVRDKDRLARAMNGVNFVFHAAALKHVPLCEYNPFDALSTNILGTQNLIDVARNSNIEKVIFISTDKAVNPVNTMGATKLMGEKLIMNAQYGEYSTLFSCVRFGNVLNSHGSVATIFKKQIEKGGPVTITSEEMTRFLMSISEAAKLVLKAMEIMKGREIFILKMKSVKILDLAKIMIEELASKYGHNPKNIGIKIIGNRPGEKLHENLVSEEELPYVRSEGDLFILKPGIITPSCVEKNLEKKSTVVPYNSKTANFFAKEELLELLRKEDLA